MNEIEAVTLINKACDEAAGLVTEKKYASAYNRLANCANEIYSSGERKALRMLFSRPGGSWDAMGHGANSRLLSRAVVDAYYRLKRAVKEIPKDDDWRGGYSDQPQP